MRNVRAAGTVGRDFWISFITLFGSALEGATLNAAANYAAKKVTIISRKTQDRPVTIDGRPIDRSFDRGGNE